MKKKFFTLFSATLVILALALLSSCSGITSPSEPEAATVHQAEGLSLRGTFSMANATAEPSLNSSSQGQSQRNAIPTIGTLTYSVKAYRPSDGATKWADVNQAQKSYVFNNTLSAGTWQITAYAKQDDITILQSETTTITLSKDRPDASANLALAPSTEGRGNIALTVSWASGTGISWVTYNCPAFSPGENQGSGYENSYTLSDSNVATGIYPITISFYKSRESTIPLYSCTEYIAVYPELTTNQWTKSTAPHISSSGQFLVTADCVKTFVYRSVYLSSSGDNDTANGTSERPYKTVEAAMARLTELANTSIHSISETTPWELHVVGTIKATSIAPSSKAFIDVPSSITYLKIVGEGSGATIDANEKGRVLYVANGANVTIQNITLQKGKVTGDGNYGGGVFVKSGGSFTIKSGSITGCSSYRGGGIYTENIVKIEGGTISGNSADTNGGGLFVLSSGKVSITGGTITGNSASNNANNILIGNCNSTSSFPDGNDSFYDDTSTTNANGKADAISLFAGKQFARFNKPASSGESSNLAQILSSLYFGNSAGTIYLGNTTDTTGKTWVIGGQINPTVALTIECPSTASTVKATIKPASSFSDYQIINHNNNNDITLKKIILDGNNSVRCISNSSGSLTMQSSTLTKGGGYTIGAGLYISGGSATIDANSSITACDNSSITSSQGGGVYISGASTSLTLEGTISGCKSKNGAGIYMDGGAVTLKESAIIGQAVENEDDIPYPTTTNINRASENGGGVYINGGTFKMEGSSKVSYNYSGNNGGGIYIRDGALDISSSSASVCNNASQSGGGGIYADGAAITLSGSVKNNKCNSSCGGIELNGGDLTTNSGSLISNNKQAIDASSNIACGVHIKASGSELKMNGGSISSNQTYDVSMTDGSFIVSGNAFAEKTYIGTSSPKITIAGSLSRYQVATITLPNYTIGAIILELASSPSPSTTLPKEYDKFPLSSTEHEIGTTGKIRKKFDAITASEITSKGSSMVDSGPLGASDLKGKIIYYITSNGTYGLMQFINFPSTFYWKTGSGDKQEKYGFQSGWGFDLDGGMTTDGNKDFGIDSGNLVPHNRAKFYTID